MPVEENKELLRKVYDLWNHKEIAAAFEFFDPGYSEHYPDGTTLRNDEEGKKFLMGFFTAFPDIVSSIDDMVAEGDKVAMRVTWRGTHQGLFMGIPATGKRIQMTNSAIFRIAGGKVAESWAHADNLGLMQQLGVIPK
jgi:steroid delta-isomerase-like uncharacterized protein